MTDRHNLEDMAGIVVKKGSVPRKEKDSSYDFGGVLTVSFAHLLHDIYSSFLAPLLPLLTKKLQLSYSMIGVLSMLSRLPSLLNPLIGVISDRIALRYLVIVAPALTCTFMSLLGLAPNQLILAGLLFLMGISAALFHVPAPVMIRRLSGNKVGRGMSFYMLGGEAARSVGPVIILGAVSLWGLEGTWKLIPFGLAVSFFFFLKLRHTRAGSAAEPNHNAPNIRNAIRSYLPLLTVLTGITASRALMKSSLTLFLPTYLTAKGNSLWFSGISLSIVELTGAIGTLYFGSISDRIGRRTSLVIISVVSPLFILLFIVTKGFWTIPVLLLTGFTLLAPTPVLLALVQEATDDHPALLNGIFMTMSFLVGALGSILVGIFSDHWGLDKTYLIAGICAIGAVPFSLLIPAKRT